MLSKLFVLLIDASSEAAKQYNPRSISQADTMQADLIDQGLTLMLVGMGTVFVFLTSLVIAMTLLSVVLRDKRSLVTEDVSDAEVAAITAAITAHRKK